MEELGRPWKFDNKTVHHREKNIYAFFKNEVKVVLAPMKEDDFPESKKNEVHPCLTS